jgi:hypothetical protein
MSDQPTTGSRRTGRRYFGWLTPFIAASLVLYFFMPRVGFEETLRWYKPEMVLLGINVAVLLVGGAMWLLARREEKKQTGG